MCLLRYPLLKLTQPLLLLRSLNFGFFNITADITADFINARHAKPHKFNHFDFVIVKNFILC